VMRGQALFMHSIILPLGTIDCCFAPHFCFTFHHTYPDDEQTTPKYTRMYVYQWLARVQSESDCVCSGFRCAHYCCRDWD
jgi:hypothetical protein